MLKNKIFFIGIMIIVLFVSTKSEELIDQTSESRDSSQQVNQTSSDGIFVI
jgi:hypothetical protein